HAPPTTLPSSLSLHDALPICSTTLELLSKARELGTVDALVLGPGAREAAAALGSHGASRVLVNEDEAFAEYLAEPASDCLAGLVDRKSTRLNSSHVKISYAVF